MKDLLRVEAVNMLKASFILKKYRRMVANNEQIVKKKKSVQYYLRFCCRGDDSYEVERRRPATKADILEARRKYINSKKAFYKINKQIRGYRDPSSDVNSMIQTH
mmetsp:Transcript_48598/g.35777  ORF Transcript_48598/g.35777 Transcript_48598/m.35777 type:complete len:105 (+) Transcript_48598:1189-1503(+)